MILKTKFSLNILAYSSSSLSKKFKMPLSTNEAGVSPGCTLEVRKTVGLLKMKGLCS